MQTSENSQSTPKRPSIQELSPSSPSSRTMRLNVSYDGAYHEAVEASAEQIMMVSQDNCSSGYTSDSETSESQDTDSCSVADDPSSLSSSSSSSCCDSEDGDIESEITFLQKKQSLLQRAISAMKREEAYDASQARATVNGTLLGGSSLWLEARETLDILNRRDGTGDSSNVRKVTESGIRTEPRVTKRPRIDVSSVVCLSSNKVGDNVVTPPTCFERALPTMPFECTGPWMAQAMVAHYIPSLTQEHDPTTPTSSIWEVVNDPDLGLLVVPPSKFPVQNGIQLKDALGLTSVAQ
jgi:hypothetical protein